MNVNYYVHTPDGDTIHLGGQSSPAKFHLRAHPERGVMTYDAWLTLLDLGEIRTESGTPLTRDEMIATANSGDWRASSRQPHDGQFFDGPHRFTIGEFH